MDGEDEIAEIERDLFSKLKRVKRNRAIYGRGLKQNNKNNGASFTLLYQSYILSQPTRLNPVVIRGSSALERTLGRQRQETWIDDPGFNIRKKSVNRGKFWNKRVQRGIRQKSVGGNKCFAIAPHSSPSALRFTSSNPFSFGIAIEVLELEKYSI